MTKAAAYNGSRKRLKNNILLLCTIESHWQTIYYIQLLYIKNSLILYIYCIMYVHTRLSKRFFSSRLINYKYFIEKSKITIYFFLSSFVNV